VDGVVARRQTSPNQTATDVLDTLPLDAWEAEFPMIDMCLRESIRLVAPGNMFRKNTSGRDIPIGKSGEVTPDGAFASYLLDNMHMNSDLYPDPLKYNPGRYLVKDTVATEEPHSYSGRGSGRHPCSKNSLPCLLLTVILEQ
jgi:cytochrome P450